MKKLLTVFLLLAAAGLAFGQFKIEVYGELNPDFLQVITPIGDAGDFDNTSGVPYQGSSRIDFFTGGVFTPGGGFTDINSLYLRMSFTGNSYDAGMRINGNHLVEWNRGFFANEPPTGADGQTDGSIGKMLESLIDEYHVRGDLGPFTIWIGNKDINQGVVDPMNNYSPSLYARVEDYGITIPGVGTPSYYDLGGLEFVELVTRSPHRTINYLPQNIAKAETADPYFLFTYALKDSGITFNLGTHLQGPVNAQAQNIHDFSTFEANGYFRVSGQNLFDLINFDAIYRIRGANQNIGNKDPTKIYRANWAAAAGGQSRSNDGEGSFGHSIGLFIQPQLDSFVQGLDAAVGYSVYFQTLEKFDANYITGASDSEVTRRAPVFTGIDLRAAYSGIDKFLFTTQHNISFTSVEGSDPAEKITYGLLPTGGAADYLPEDNANSWIYFYNSLAAQYMVSDIFSAHLGIANRYGVLTKKEPSSYTTDISRITNNWLSVDLMASWVFARGVGSWELWTGLSMLHQYSTLKSNIFTAKDQTGGRFVFAIPIHIVWSIAN